MAQGVWRAAFMPWRTSGLSKTSYFSGDESFRSAPTPAVRRPPYDYMTREAREITPGDTWIQSLHPVEDIDQIRPVGLIMGCHKSQPHQILCILLIPRISHVLRLGLKRQRYRRYVRINRYQGHISAGWDLRGWGMPDPPTQEVSTSWPCWKYINMNLKVRLGSRDPWIYQLLMRRCWSWTRRSHANMKAYFLAAP